MDKLKPKRKITHASAKAKGRALQKLMAQKISTLIGLPCGKDEPIESRGGGQSGTDVRLDTAALKLFPFSVECKWQESWSIPSWMKQAQANQKEGTDWLLVCKRSNVNPIVVMDLETFLEMQDRLLKGNNDG